MLNPKHKKSILVIRVNSSIKRLLPQGVQKLQKGFLESLLYNFEFKERYLMEQNPEYKQVIPYVTFVYQKKVLVYKRSPKGSENRIHENYSLGIGGHIDFRIGDEFKNPLLLLKSTAQREIKEELGVTVPKKELVPQVIINDDSNSIGRVHLGVGFIIYKNILDLGKGELDIIVERNFLNKREIEQSLDKFETWSQFLYKDYLKPLL